MINIFILQPFGGAQTLLIPFANFADSVMDLQTLLHNLRKYDPNLTKRLWGAGNHSNRGLLPDLQTQLWIYKPYYTTYMKKYPVLCV